VAVLVVALAGVGFAFHRWRRAMSPAPASDADWAMVDAARQDLHAEDGAQVESPRSR
jgi:hypothetical protein